jgi:hypothetical protein
MTRDEVIEQVRSVTWVQLKSYLLTGGWQDDGEVGPFASIWHRAEPEHQDAEVILPTSQNARDFWPRLADAAIAIAGFEKRSPTDVIAEATGHLADLIRVRVEAPDVNGGTIPINDGVRLNQHGRDLMTASAVTAQEKRRHFRGRKKAETVAYLDGLRLGQTGHGSYVINIIAPLPPERLNQPTLEHVSWTSVVTANLTAGLEALDHAIENFEQGGSRLMFEEAVVRGASANMCDALVGLSGQDKRRSVEISISPSRSVGTAPPTRTFTFSTEKIAQVAEASLYYKQDYLVRSRVVQGYIKRLDRPTGQEIGTVWVEARVEGVERTVAIDLGPENYHEATLAHDRMDIVRCHGDVHVTARTATLINPTGFQVVLNAGDLFDGVPGPTDL